MVDGFPTVLPFVRIPLLLINAVLFCNRLILWPFVIDFALLVLVQAKHHNQVNALEIVRLFLGQEIEDPINIVGAAEKP